MCKVNVGNVVMKGQILKELADVQAMHKAIVEFVESTSYSKSYFFNARVEEGRKLANRIIDLQDAYDNDCPECMGSAYHVTKFYQQHGCCEHCFWNAWDDVDLSELDETEHDDTCDDFDLEEFYGTGDSNEEYPMLGKVEEVEDTWLCGDCNKLFDFSPFASITEGTCLCPSCFDDSRYEVRFVTSAVNEAFGGHVENVAKFDNESEAIWFVEKHSDLCLSISITRYSNKY